MSWAEAVHHLAQQTGVWHSPEMHGNALAGGFHPRAGPCLAVQAFALPRLAALAVGWACEQSVRARASTVCALHCCLLALAALPNLGFAHFNNAALPA